METLWTIIFWGAVAYFALGVLWYLGTAIMVVIGAYAESGIWAALGAAVFVFLAGCWQVIKFVIGIAVLLLIIKGCQSFRQEGVL